MFDRDIDSEYEEWQKSKGGAVDLSKEISRVKNPQTKEDYMLRLDVIAEVGEAGYSTVSSKRDWENYGKSRTYLKIDAYREQDGKYHHSRDYGYYDNVNKKYNPPRNVNNLDGKIFTVSGAYMSDEQIETALKSIENKKSKSFTRAFDTDEESG